MVSVEDSAVAPSVDFDRSALLLDIDGTLLDIAPVPEAVIVPPELLRAIEKLYWSLDGAVAFISGRRIASIDSLFDPLVLPAVGCHGAEYRRAPGSEIETASALPDDIKQFAHKLSSVASGIRVEDKGYTLAIHFRLAPEAEPALLAALREQRDIVGGTDIQILRGKSVLEIKPRAFNKATGFRRLMSEAPFSKRIPVFLGDDTTDEDVFRVLPHFDGLGLSVGRRIDGAAFTFQSPAAVRDWLARLAEGA